MSEHFRAFSFVDRILEDEVGRRIAGEYLTPAEIDSFPLSLVSEAIGQCAAMSSMKAVGFRFRPVAGIAGGVDFLGDVEPGDSLRLEATLVKSDEEAVGYDGVALVNGNPVVRLRDCLGPMVAMEDFDDPAAVGGRYDLLRSSGAEPGLFPGIPEFSYETTAQTAGESSEGLFQIPDAAPFFGDHFPRKPVFPGTLLMNLNLQFVADLAATLPGDRLWKPTGMESVKLRAFMPPGENLTLRAEVEEIGEDKAVILVQSRRGKRLNSGARVLLSH